LELSSPIRLYWDITPAPVTDPDYNRICFEIDSSRALTLHLTDLGETLSPVTSVVLSRLSTSSLALMLTVSYAAVFEVVPIFESVVKKLYVDVASPEAIAGLSGTGISGISFRTSHSNHRLLPDIVAVCIDSGIPELQLPMERLTAGEAPLCLTVPEQEDLSARISKIQFAGKLTVTANDPFLWRAVYPETPFPDGICQAANTMLAIAPNGDVSPCPAMPLLLGNLQQSTYREIIGSILKKEVRERILAFPPACKECRMLHDCRGGCRGRGLNVAGDFGAVDPGCGII